MGMPAAFIEQSTYVEKAPHFTNSHEVRLGSRESIPMGQGRAFTFGSLNIAVFRMRNGELRAIDNNCPHRGGPLAEGLVGDNVVVCPFHAWKFDLKTGACMNDAVSVRTYPIRESAGTLLLTLPNA